MYCVYTQTQVLMESLHIVEVFWEGECVFVCQVLAIMFGPNVPTRIVKPEQR